MKGAETDVGLFKIYVAAVRRMADKQCNHESLMRKLFDTAVLLNHNIKPVPLWDNSYQAAFEHAYKKNGGNRSAWDVAHNAHQVSMGRYQKKLDVNTDQIIRNYDFQDAEFAVPHAMLVVGRILDLGGKVLQLRRSLYKWDRKPDCDHAITILEDDGLITRCCDCDEYEYTEDLVYVNDEGICRSCIEGSYTWSEYEDEYIHNDNCMTALDEDGNRVVVSEGNDYFVWDDDEDMYVHVDYQGGSSRILRSYHSSKGSHRFIKSKWIEQNGPYYMGCELEVEVKNGNAGDKAELLHAALNKGRAIGHMAFFEEDGSLSYGFEIITQPMGLDLHEEFWQWTQNRDLKRNLVSHNTSTCGLHIHLNRAPLTQLQINKMITFINHPDNEPFVRALARRYGQHYCAIKPKKLGSAHKTDDRYEAINLQNSRTIEFRIFKGTLKYEAIMAALEFVNALRNFTTPASGAGFDLSADRFLHFIHEGAAFKETKNLRPYIEQRMKGN